MTVGTQGAQAGATERAERGLGRFMLLAYAITWLTLGPWFYAFNGPLEQQVPWWAWVILPVLILGGWGPSVAAVICEWIDEGRQGVKRLLKTLLVWRVHIVWYAFVLVLPVVLTGIATLASDFGPTALGQIDPAAMLANVPLALLIALPFGPCEELGWRGYALPRLLRTHGIWVSTVLLGAAWTFWHVPMLFLMPGAALPSFLPPTPENIVVYLVRNVAITGIMTFAFCNTRGSVLMAVLFHLTFNTSENILFAGLPMPTNEQLRQIYFINIGLMSALALGLLAWLGRAKPSPETLVEAGVRVSDARRSA